MTDRSLTAADIADRLGLKRHPRSWRGGCPVCSYPNAFTLRSGTLLRPVPYCSNGCTRPELQDALARRLGDTWQPQVPVAAPDPEAGRERRKAASLRMWCRRHPDDRLRAYLASRGLAGREVSSALGFLGDASHPELGGRIPAMLAQVVEVDGQHCGVHRTFLRPDGAGKAAVTPDRASLGPIWGGAVRLDPVARELVIGEGIESSASAGRMLELPAWAALSAGNLATGLRLPAEVRNVIVAADHDLPTRDGKRPGQDAADAAAARWRAEGRKVRLLMPDEPGTDFNDLLMRQARHG